MKIKINPLSVNQCWQGRRFKTPKYKAYEEELTLKLGNWEPEFREWHPGAKDARIKIWIEASINKLMDIDNIAKPILDILQKKYGFNDRNIYELKLTKRTGKDRWIDINIK